MTRLGSALRLDFLIERRYGFLYASFASVPVWVAVLTALPEQRLGAFVPAVVFVDIALVGFYFIAGLVLYEKDEATLYALIVSPLRFREYLTSKLVSLTALALVLSALLVTIAFGFSANWPYVLLGTALMSVTSLLVGFIAVSPFSSFSAYLIPSQVYAFVLYLPLIPHFGLWESPVFYLIPTQGAMLLLAGGFTPITAWQVVYALVSGTVWVVALSLIAGRMFDRYVVERQGRR